MFPLAFRCFFGKLIKTGFLPTFKHGDILGYFFSTFFLGYVYSCEAYSNVPQL